MNSCQLCDTIITFYKHKSYCLMLSKSESLFRRAKKIIPSGVNSPARFYEPYPFFAISGRDSKIVTADHKTCIDYCMGYGSLLFGHAYVAIIESVKSQLDNGSLFCIPTEKEVKLAELISKVVPCAEMTRLVNTGSEATMNAIRLARAYTKKKKIIKFDGCYHGAYDYVLINAGSSATGIPVSEGIIEEVSSQTIVVPYNDYVEVERLSEKHQDIACVIIEPVFANMGLVLPEKQYLNEIRRITQKNEIVLIFDEVITGFRLALGGAGEFFGIKPDLATFAKAMGNGFPIAAIAGKKEIMEQFAPNGNVYQASTYAGNPASVSAGIATIETLIKVKDEIYPKIARTCDCIVEGIKDTLEEYKLNCTLNTIGSMYQLFFTSEKVKDAKSAKKSNTIIFRKLYDELLERGIFVPPSQFETCFVSYAHTEDDVDETLESYSNALRKVKEVYYD
jgi:glutamate-1-semialdehyde 2,1-aminomutase